MEECGGQERLCEGQCREIIVSVAEGYFLLSTESCFMCLHFWQNSFHISFTTEPLPLLLCTWTASLLDYISIGEYEYLSLSPVLQINRVIS